MFGCCRVLNCVCCFVLVYCMLCLCVVRYVLFCVLLFVLRRGCCVLAVACRWLSFVVVFFLITGL